MRLLPVSKLPSHYDKDKQNSKVYFFHLSIIITATIVYQLHVTCTLNYDHNLQLVSTAAGLTNCTHIICADTVPVELYYDANLKWHMPIWGGICRTEQNYMPFLGRWPSAFSGKKFQSTGTYKSKMMQRCARIFSGKTRSVTVQRLRFFPRFTDKG